MKYSKKYSFLLFIVVNWLAFVDSFISHRAVHEFTVKLIKLHDKLLIDGVNDPFSFERPANTAEILPLTATRPRDVSARAEEEAVIAVNTIVHSLRDALEMAPPSSADTVGGAEAYAEFYQMVAATVRFLYVLQEAQVAWNWSSGRLGAKLAVLQQLWASRKGNSYRLSFVEQQIYLYKPIPVQFGKHELLLRNVEIIEYLNDLTDLCGGQTL
ncbi:hypothetical protein BGHDH14_bghG003293000002001 [Blumeria hordei DH14]|uniref:Uncharacterized protein n=1 Tax=Blumeria graminis f. sp. hordei (strain DH14) TaxID=546991 RepID=N1JA81_BLUG1|nr:hypothetical protein BGHDH14_bghG003293000002001 [Blumeria hordei DH14]